MTDFLEVEIRILARAFDRVVCIPMNPGGVRQELPANVGVDLTFATWRRSPIRLAGECLGRVFWSPVLWDEVRSHLRWWVRPRVFCRGLRRLADAYLLTRWLERYLSDLNVTDAICYTYWLGAETAGVGLARRCGRIGRIVSRAHGIDVYDERHSPPYIPFRRRTMESCDVIATVSQNGRDYLSARYPEFAQRIQIRRLGVPASGYVTRPSGDGAIRVVSCSYLSAVKRPALLVDSIEALARKAGGRRIRWTHLGGGPMESAIRELAAQRLAGIAEWTITGSVGNSDVMAYYARNEVDVLLSTSESEGIPFSMMEVQSCGIPVVATAVGGVPEIVDAGNGRLVPAEADGEALADAILEAVAAGPSLRAASFENWKIRYDADANFEAFAVDVLCGRAPARGRPSIDGLNSVLS